MLLFIKHFYAIFNVNYSVQASCSNTKIEIFMFFVPYTNLNFTTEIAVNPGKLLTNTSDKQNHLTQTTKKHITSKAQLSTTSFILLPSLTHSILACSLLFVNIFAACTAALREINIHLHPDLSERRQLPSHPIISEILMMPQIKVTTTSVFEVNNEVGS